MSTHVEAYLEGGPHDGATRIIDDRDTEWDPDVEGWVGCYERQLVDRSYPSTVWVWVDDPPLDT
jgi:hypothetical protein